MPRMSIDRSRSTPAKLRAPAQRVATDPKPRDDGTCLFEDCGKPLPRIGVLNADPFCSTVCCRRWYEAAL
jgi:hypothetical protein